MNQTLPYGDISAWVTRYVLRSFEMEIYDAVHVWKHFE
jgi:hypothetical protein